MRAGRRDGCLAWPRWRAHRVRRARGPASASPLAWSSPQQVDDARPYGHAPELPAVNCPTAEPVRRADRALPARAGAHVDRPHRERNAPWKATRVDTTSLHEISCPSASLCVAVDDVGNLVTSTDPSGGAGAWSTPVSIGGGLSAVACPSTTLCVALSLTGMRSSRRTRRVARARGPPTARYRGAWASSPTCPARRSRCASTWPTTTRPLTAVVSTTDPMAGDTWTVTAIASGNRADRRPGFAAGGLSCPSVNLCVAVDGGATRSCPPIQRAHSPPGR